MTKPNTVEELVIFQCISSAVFMSFKNKGLSEEQVAVLLDGESEQLIHDVTEGLTAKIDALIVSSPVKLDPIDEPWMIDVANRAVEANLNVDGSDKYQSAQGYACALEALKIASKWRGDELRTDSADEEVPEESKKEKITRRARELFNVTKQKYGEESAYKTTFEYLAEQYGLATLADLDVPDAVIHRLRTDLVNLILTKI